MSFSWSALQQQCFGSGPPSWAEEMIGEEMFEEMLQSSVISSPISSAKLLPGSMYIPGFRSAMPPSTRTSSTTKEVPALTGVHSP
eukprot:4673728-Alexandrium_andersonii.AAC.1